MTEERPRYPDDHPIAVLRGHRVPRPTDVRARLRRRQRMLAARVEELQERAGRRRWSPVFDELRAVTVALELLEAAACVDGGHAVSPAVELDMFAAGLRAAGDDGRAEVCERIARKMGAIKAVIDALEPGAVV